MAENGVSSDLTEADAATLLAHEAEVSVGALPNAALEVAKLCGGHPLALSLVGAMVRRGFPWGEVHDRLKSVQPQDAHRRNDSIIRAIKLSYEELKKEEQERLLELAGEFAKGQLIEEPEIFHLWERNGGMSESESRDVLSVLRDRGLINLYQGTPNRRVVTLHPLVHQFLRTVSPE